MWKTSWMRTPDHVVDLPLKYMNDERYKILGLRRAEHDRKAKAGAVADAGKAGAERSSKETAQAGSLNMIFPAAPE